MAVAARKAFRGHIARPQHFVPTAEGFGAAVRAGLGWGHVSGQPRRTRAWPKAHSYDVRCAPRRPAVLAVLEVASRLVQTITDAVATAAGGLLRHWK